MQSYILNSIHTRVSTLKHEKRQNFTLLGAKPVFVDSERDSWNMDPQLLEEAIKAAIVE